MYHTFYCFTYGWYMDYIWIIYGWYMDDYGYPLVNVDITNWFQIHHAIHGKTRANFRLGHLPWRIHWNTGTLEDKPWSTLKSVSLIHEKTLEWNHQKYPKAWKRCCNEQKFSPWTAGFFLQVSSRTKWWKDPTVTRSRSLLPNISGSENTRKYQKIQVIRWVELVETMNNLPTKKSTTMMIGVFSAHETSHWTILKPGP